MKFTDKLEKMELKQLHGLARAKYGLRPDHNTDKDLLIWMIEDAEKELQESITEAKNEAFMELGKALKTAISYYSGIHSIPEWKFTPEDYEAVVSQWKLLSMITNSIDEQKSFNLDEVYQDVKSVYCPDDKEVATAEEKQSFIIRHISNFKLDTRSRAMKKEVYPILKMNIDDILYNENGDLFVDTSEAVTLEAENIDEIIKTSGSYGEISYKKSVMRWVKTAQDGIAEDLKTKKGPRYHKAVQDGITGEELEQYIGLQTVSVNMISKKSPTANENFNDYVNQFSDEELEKMYGNRNPKLVDVFKNGFTDVHTGIHYLFGFQNASAKRQANYTFVEADDYKEVYQLWYDVTGTGNEENFQKAFKLNKGGNFSKTLTRISSRGSNGMNLIKLGEKVDIDLSHPKVLNVPDKKTLVEKPMSKIMNPEHKETLEERQNNKFKLTAMDGSFLMNVETNVKWSYAYGTINKKDFEYFMDKWEKLGKSLAKAGRKAKLRKILLKTGRIWQIRGGEDCAQSYKGIGVVANYENLKAILTAELAEQLNKLNATSEFAEGQELDLSKYDMIVPESVRKYMINNLSSNTFNFEICNHLKKKGDWVYMNPQFIAALNNENPELLLPIAKYWMNMLWKSFNSVDVLAYLLKVMKSASDEDAPDGEEDINVSVDLGEVIRTNHKLTDEHKILGDYLPKFEKLIKDMKHGRIAVPGMYTYMVYDPMFFLNELFGLKEHYLQKGEYWHNNKSCRAGLFRSPLVAAFQAQRVQLVADEAYWIYKDTIVFNGYDGIWEAMGGADFDGDTCAVVPDCDSLGFGKIIVDAIRDIDYNVLIEGAPDVQYGKWTSDYNDELIDYLERSAKRDETGSITNASTRLFDIINHILGLMYHATKNGCKKIRFIHPEKFKKEGIYKGKSYGYYGKDFTYIVEEDTLVARGIVSAKWDFDNKKYIFDKQKAIVGEYTFEKLEKLLKDKELLIEISSQYQMIEIDGAKTGLYAEDMGYDDTFKYDNTATWFLSRKMYQGRLLPQEITKTKELNSYVSFSVLGTLHDFINKNEHLVLERFKQGNNKIALLKSLMTEKELADINKSITFKKTGRTATLLEIVKERKDKYNLKIRNKKAAESEDIRTEEENLLDINEQKQKAAASLIKLAKNAGVSEETIACAAYLATNDRDSHQSTGLSYGWLLWKQLLNVFGRDNQMFEMVKIPDGTEVAEIINGALYVDGNKYMPINAQNGVCPIKHFDMDRAYAYVKKVNGEPVIQRVSKLSAGIECEIGVYGFGYHGRKAKNSKDWINFVSKANNILYIAKDEKGNVCTGIVDSKGEQHILAQLLIKNSSEDNTDIDLIGKKVEVLNLDEMKVTERAIKEIRVRVIG